VQRSPALNRQKRSPAQLTNTPRSSRCGHRRAAIAQRHDGGACAQPSSLGISPRTYSQLTTPRGRASRLSYGGLSAPAAAAAAAATAARTPRPKALVPPLPLETQSQIERRYGGLPLSLSPSLFLWAAMCERKGDAVHSVAGLQASSTPLVTAGRCRGAAPPGDTGVSPAAAVVVPPLALTPQQPPTTKASGAAGGRVSPRHFEAVFSQLK
jgi:hypothetical protein